MGNSAIGTWKSITSDARFSLSGEMLHPLSHQETLDAKAKELGCALPSDLTVEHDEAGTEMRNRPEPEAGA